MHPRTLGHLLEHSADTGKLLPHAQRLLALRHALSGALPTQLRRSCEIANYKQGIVVIFAENGALATKLKLLVPSLIQHLRKSAGDLTAIRVEVQPAIPVRQPPAKQAVLTDAAAKALRELEAQLPDYKLKSAIAVLASRARKGK